MLLHLWNKTEPHIRYIIVPLLIKEKKRQQKLKLEMEEKKSEAAWKVSSSLICVMHTY
jgi:hypothetical protein